jgi:hypothetical protein
MFVSGATVRFNKFKGHHVEQSGHFNMEQVACLFSPEAVKMSSPAPASW